MTKNISVEKKPASKSSHRRSPAQSSHQPNGAFLKNLTTGRLSKKIFDNVNTNMALGLIAMGLAGAATLLILNKNQRAKNKSLYRTYSDVRDNAKEFADNVYEKGKKAYETASDYAENIKDTAYDVSDQPYSVPLLIAGTVGGTLIGASLLYLLNKDKNVDRTFLSRAIHAIDSLKDAASTASDNVKTTDWSGIASGLIETLSEKLHGDEDEEEPHRNKNGHVMDNLQHAIDMGITGFRLWQKLKNHK
ncbi:MAG: YtxH domain-containing protein [Parachlamydiaceae bacterium]|nr:YtxH domain-containing protein [Parachlamydiaceae bacterium]